VSTTFPSKADFFSSLRLTCLSSVQDDELANVMYAADLDQNGVPPLPLPSSLVLLHLFVCTAALFTLPNHLQVLKLRLR